MGNIDRTQLFQLSWHLTDLIMLISDILMRFCEYKNWKDALIF